MKVLFVDLSHNFYDSHGIFSLAAVLKKNSIDADYVTSNSFNAILKDIDAIGPDLVCYSSFSTTLSKYIAFDKLLKTRKNIRSLIGGPGPTYSPKMLSASTIDAYCAGEGESAIVEYVNSGFVPSKNIRSCSAPDSEGGYYDFVDLDKIPFPNREIVYRRDALLRDQPSKQFFSGRGCPYNCTYCFNHSFRNMFRECGPVIRKKSVGYMIDEIIEVRKRYPLASVVFNDDLFIMDKKWIFEFCEAYARKINLPFTCNVRSNLLDEDIAQALSAAGCKTANWSIESGDDYLRNTVLRRNTTVESILTTSNLLNKYKIRSRIGNILGLPGETEKQMHATLQLNIKAKPELAIASIFLPFPGLELTRYAIDNNYLAANYSALPTTFYQKSPLIMSDVANKRLQTLVYLFPIFVAFPGLYSTLAIRRVLMRLPIVILSPIFEMVTTVILMRLYVVKTPVPLRVKMLFRHIRNTRFGEIYSHFFKPQH